MHGELGAGSHPGKLNPYAVTVMKEAGIDISGHRSKSVDDLPASFVSSGALAAFLLLRRS